MTIFEATIITSATVSVLSLRQTSSPSPQWASENFYEQIAKVILPLKMLPPPPPQSRSVVSDSATPWTVVHGILQARILEWVAFPFRRLLIPSG